MKVPTADFIAGTLPEVCVRTGLLAKNRYQIAARTPSGQLTRGAVSLHGSVARRVAMFRLGGALGAALAIASLIVGAAIGAAPLFALAAIAGGLAGLSLHSAGRSGVAARVVDDGEFIELSPASDGFKLAIIAPASKCSGSCSNGACSASPGAEVCDDHEATVV